MFGSPLVFPRRTLVCPPEEPLNDLLDQLQETFGSNYTMKRELRAGGMARVFVARDETLGRDVVVKVLPPELTYNSRRHGSAGRSSSPPRSRSHTSFLCLPPDRR